MYKLIGVAGKKQNGKDTIGEYLQDNYGYYKIGFADPVKKGVYILNPFIPVGDDPTTRIYCRLQDLVDTLGWEETKKFPEVRRLLQQFGTEVGRQIFGEDIWIKLLEKRLETLDKVVITDIRFANEAEFVRNKGGFMTYVSRPEHQEGDEHASEAGLCSEYYDEEIINDGCIADLHDKIDYVLNQK